VSWIIGLLLGILQGITEFLPVSSSGHLELLQTISKVPEEVHLLFDVTLHFATVLSILTVYRKEVWELVEGGIRLEQPALSYIGLLLLSAIPAGIVGLFFKDTLEKLLFGNLWVVAFGFLITALLLFASKRAKAGSNTLSWRYSLGIGIAQAVALVPGISRSGATISTALLYRVNPNEAARFAFLMLPIPVIGASLLELKEVIAQPPAISSLWLVLLIGFVAAYVTGIFACRWVITLVHRNRFHLFGYYCLGMSLITFLLAWLK
jgi:undecaprenyl-diphosphatase